MHSWDQHSVLTMKFFALFLKCPMGEAAGHCPFSPIRAEQNLDLKFEVAETMAAHRQHDSIMALHDACFQERLNQLIAPRKHAQHGQEIQKVA